MIFTNPKENQYLRRWINIIPQYFIPGGAYFFSGNYYLAIINYITIFIFFDVYGWYLISSKTTGYANGLFILVVAVIWLIFFIHSCTKKIPKYNLKRKIVIFLPIVVLIYALNFMVAFWIKANYFEAFKYSGKSMYPTLMDTEDYRDRVLVNKTIYKKNSAERGDVVVFFAPYDPNEIIVERVVGLPGETVSIDPAYVIVNGERLETPAIFKKISGKSDGYGGYYNSKSPYGLLNEPTDEITLGKNEYFLLGDNNKISNDSRYFGPVHKESIIGKVYKIYSPSERFGLVE